jgi:hypothetical protein
MESGPAWNTSVQGRQHDPYATSPRALASERCFSLPHNSSFSNPARDMCPAPKVAPKFGNDSMLD